jgi:hypothetical protein
MAEPKKMDLKNCTVILRDGAGSPVELELKMDEGNLQFTHGRNIEVQLDRGIVDYLKEGDEVPLEVQFEGRFSAIRSSSGDDVTPYEFLTGTGRGTTIVSTSGVCEARACDIVVEVDHSGCGTTVVSESILFEDFTYEKIDGNFKDGTLSFSGKCKVLHPVGTRTTV